MSRSSTYSTLALGAFVAAPAPATAVLGTYPTKVSYVREPPFALAGSELLLRQALTGSRGGTKA